MITRQEFALGAAASGAASLMAADVAFAATAPKNIVLVHGLYADGSCWSDVIVRLQAAGLSVTSVQNPLTTFADDVAATMRALDMQDGPTLLIGHSYGGMVATETGLHSNVVGLVYIAARAPDVGENYTALTKRFPIAPASGGLMKFGNYLRLSESAFINDFANGVDHVKARELYAVQQPNLATLSPQARTTVAAWRTRPSWYAVSKQDRTINPGLQRFMAGRMKATTIELDSGHLSIVSHAQQVSAFILEAAGTS